MKRKLALSLLLALLLCLALPSFASASFSGNLSYVTDSAGILTESQRQELEDMAAGISEKYQCGVYIVTTQDYTEFGRGSISTCAEEIYDRYLIGFGETGDGILLLLSMSERDFDLDAHGSFGNYAFSSEQRDRLVSAFASHFRSDDWYGGLKAYLIQAEQRLVRAEEGYPSYLEGLHESQAEQEKMINGAKGVGSVFAGLLTALGVCSGMKRQMKTAREKDDADEYMTPTSPHMKVVQDHFLNRTRTVQVIPQESRDSSGGHSGGGFSGHSHTSGKF